MGFTHTISILDAMENVWNFTKYVAIPDSDLQWNGSRMNSLAMYGFDMECNTPY